MCKILLEFILFVELMFVGRGLVEDNCMNACKEMLLLNFMIGKIKISISIMRMQKFW